MTGDGDHLNSLIAHYSASIRRLGRVAGIALGIAPPMAAISRAVTESAIFFRAISVVAVLLSFGAVALIAVLAWSRSRLKRLQ